jgi:HEPN domain-containing protein
MTLRERYPPDDPREWLARARSSLTFARSETEGVDLENFCFEAQQAAEKAIKAVMISRGITFPYIHNLTKLLRMLEKNGEQLPPQVWEAEELTTYAHETRYPSPEEPVTKSEYDNAVAITETVVGWASGLIEQSNSDQH